MNIEDQEADQLKMIGQLAALDARGLMRYAQRIVDDMKHDVRDGAEQHLAASTNEYVAFGRVLGGKHAR